MNLRGGYLFADSILIFRPIVPFIDVLMCVRWISHVRVFFSFVFGVHCKPLWTFTKSISYMQRCQRQNGIPNQPFPSCNTKSDRLMYVKRKSKSVRLLNRMREKWETKWLLIRFWVSIEPFGTAAFDAFSKWPIKRRNETEKNRFRAAKSVHRVKYINNTRNWFIWITAFHCFTTGKCENHQANEQIFYISWYRYKFAWFILAFSMFAIAIVMYTCLAHFVETRFGLLFFPLPRLPTVSSTNIPNILLRHFFSAAWIFLLHRFTFRLSIIIQSIFKFTICFSARCSLFEDGALPLNRIDNHSNESIKW